MCGILAYYNKKGISKEHINASLLALNKIKHRGPDGEGIVLINTKLNTFKILKTDDTPDSISSQIKAKEVINDDFDLLLGHRRLSIFDLSTAGHQPMNGKNNSWITYNGEIYNFFEIKKELQNLGHKFRTNTDTEVILIAFEEWGKSCLNKFNGMWSFVLWTGKELIISNDRFGVKPLYYFKDEDELIFFSETKQILAFPNRVTKYNQRVIDEFLYDGNLDHSNETFFNNVYRYPVASFSILKLPFPSSKLIATQLFYQLPTEKSSITKEKAIQLFRETLKSAIEIRLRGDVETGIAISGGLDSSSIIYATSKQLKQEKIKTFSAVFPNEMGDESKYINIVKEDLKLQSYKTNPYTEFNFPDFVKHIYHQDTPVLTTSPYAQWCVDRLTHQNGVKIFLNGQGADEAFGGYHHHFYKYCKSLILKGKIRKYLVEVNKYAALKGWKVNKLHKIVLADVKLAAKFKLSLQRKNSSIKDEWNNAKNLSEILRIDLTKTAIPNYLKTDDRNGMAFSIESRHPFMDYRMIELGLSLKEDLLIRNGWQKLIIREAMDEMPKSVRWRKDKKGFTTPQEKWIKEYQKDFESYLPHLEELNITPKKEFRYYSLAIWLSLNKI